MSNPAPKTNDVYEAAFVEFEARNFAKTIEICHDYLEHDRNDAAFVLLLGKALLHTGRLGQAQNYFIKANRLKPNDSDILANMGRLLYKNTRYMEAQQALAKAVCLTPEDKTIKISFIQSLVGTVFQNFDKDIKAAIQIVMEDKTLRHRMIFAPWYTMMLCDPALKDWAVFRGGDPYRIFSQRVTLPACIEVLNNDYLGIGLKRCIIHNEQLERALTNTRRGILESGDKILQRTLRPFLCALATQAFFSEYMFYVPEEEIAQLAKFKENAATADDYLLLACYDPLFSFGNSAEIGALLHAENDDALKEISRIQIDEPLQEQAIKEKILSFTAIDDEVSKAVKQQYEESPYPRWISLSGTVLSEAKLKSSEGMNVLIAGCGTGQQAVTTAINFPRAKVEAIDLSFSSLSYAKRKTEEMDIDNLNFQQGDLLKIADMGQTFDLIASGGVLHHMDSPEDGLRALRDILAPKGTLKIALYSEIARKNIVIVQNWVKEQGYAATPEGMRAFRNHVLYEPNDPVIQPLKPLPGMLSASETRDTFFNVQEHRFTCLQLKELLDSLDLELLAFAEGMTPLRQRYAQMFPEDTHLVDLKKWHEFEQKYPDSFLMMYRLLLARKGDYQAGELPKWAQHEGAIF